MISVYLTTASDHTALTTAAKAIGATYSHAGARGVLTCRDEFASREVFRRAGVLPSVHRRDNDSHSDAVEAWL